MSVRIDVGSTLIKDIGSWVDFTTTGGVTKGTSIRKFGKALGVSTTEQDLWIAPVLNETLKTLGVTMYCSSEDNTNGVGQVLQVSGLDENWDQQTGLCTLTGQTQAAITKVDGSAAEWTRIHRAFQVSPEPDPIGDVYIAESDTLTLGVPDTGTKIHGYIDYTTAAQQTEKGMYTVPRGYAALVLGMTAGMRKSSGGSTRSAEVFIEVQELARGYGIESPQWAPFRRVTEASLFNAGQVWIPEMFTVPLVFNELTNIHMRCEATAASDITGAMYITIAPVEYLP